MCWSKTSSLFHTSHNDTDTTVHKCFCQSSNFCKIAQNITHSLCSHLHCSVHLLRILISLVFLSFPFFCMDSLAGLLENAVSKETCTLHVLLYLYWAVCLGPSLSSTPFCSAHKSLQGSGDLALDF